MKNYHRIQEESNENTIYASMEIYNLDEELD